MAEPTRDDRAATAAHTPAAQPTVVRPDTGAPDPSATAGAPPGFVLGGELGEGGMGIVYAATDTELGREVAIKTLRRMYASASAAARFVEEARITARLQHPGIPPIYRTGELPDGRPFLAMKLIRGRTLAALLADNPSLEDRLSAFEQVCLAVGYAHGRGVIHRDLKPANVMVGAFGEVQVMDWGLAKVLGEVPAASPESGTDAAADETRAGAAMGTPQYMPPEQARGAWHEVDERADVFALGGVLAVLLTGAPPYTGPTSRAVLTRAEAGDLTDCFARLDACGADAELIALAERCLSAERAARPANAGEVAEAVAAHRAGVRAKLAAAETARAAAEVEAREQKRRRRVQLALAGAVLLLAVGGGAVAVREGVRAERERTEEARRETERLRLEGEKDRAERDRAAVLERNRARVPELLAQATDQRRKYLFAEAEKTIGSAAELAKELPDIAAEVAQARTDLALVVELDTIRDKKWVRVFNEQRPDGARVIDYFDTKSAPPAYQKALAARGFDPDGDPAVLVARVRDSGVRTELVAALDDWALYEKDAARTERLLAALRLIDPGDWLDRFRTSAARASQRALLELAAERPADLAPSTLTCLAELLTRQEVDPTSVLAAGTQRYPDNFTLAFARGIAGPRLNEQRRIWRPVRKVVTDAAAAVVRGVLPVIPTAPAPEWRPQPRRAPDRVPPRMLPPTIPYLAVTVTRVTGLEGLSPSELVTSIGFLRVAQAARPDNVYVAYNLGNVLAALGEDDEAVAAFRAALARDPNLLAARINVTEVYRRQWMWEELADSARKVLARDPASMGHTTNCLAEAYDGLRDPDPRLRAHREAAELQPANASARNNYANVLVARGKTKEAIAEYREALRLKPDHDLALPALGRLLFRNKDFKGAVEIYERWVKHYPESDSYCALAEALLRNNNPTRAAELLNEAIEKKIDTAEVRCGLGYIARSRNLWQLAVQQYIEAARRDPKSVRAFGAIGDIYAQQGDWKRAAIVFQKLTELTPNDADAFNVLGVCYYKIDKFAESARAYRGAIALVPPSARLYDTLGLALRGEGDAAWARWAFARALEIDPKLFSAHNNLGLCLMDAGDLDGAVNAFRAATDLNPKYARAHFNLGTARHRLGDLPGAATAYTNAANADPKAWSHLKAWLPLNGTLAPEPRAKTSNP